MKNKTLDFVVAASLILTGPAFAAGKEESSNSQTPAEKLADLQQRRALNRVRVEIAKQEEELSNTRKGQSAAAPAVPSTYSAPPPRPGMGGIPDSGMPTLLSLTAVGDHVTATVAQGSLRVAVKPGDVLSGGWIVKRVELSGLTVERANQTRVLRP